jgi:hypothetical protein
MKKLMIGGQALRKLGSDRHTNDTDYLVNDTKNTNAFIFDEVNNIDYINANGNKFFNAVWEMEKENDGEIATPQALLELKAYAFVQHCQNFNWKKVDSTEYDIKFLARTFGLKELKVVTKFISKGELSEIMKVINSVKK